jgi:RNA polymerase sigma factor (sigma-70 family)
LKSVDARVHRNHTSVTFFFHRPAICIARKGGSCNGVVVDDIKLLFSKLRRLLYSRGQTSDDTEDLIQEAFLRLQQYDRERVVNHREAFLVRTVLNLLTDRHRQRRAGALTAGALETLSLIDPSPTPDVICDSRKRLAHFEAGLLALSPRQREVFILHRIDGYSFAQIAERLGITISMAEKHAARALLSLGDWMDQEEAPDTRGRRSGR